MSAIRPPASPVDPDTDVNAGSPSPVGFDSRTTGDPSKAVAEQEPIVRPRRHPLAPKQYLWIVGALVVLFVALTWLGPVLTPFLIGAILAYLGTPAVARAERRGVPRSLATLFVILFIGLLLAALFLVLIPLVQSEVGSITRKLPDLFAQFTDRVAPFLQEKFDVSVSLDFDSIRTFIAENAQEARNLSTRLLSGVKTGGAIVLSLLVNLALIPVVMFYLLRDWNMILARIDDLLPRRWGPKVRSIGREVDGVLAEFLHGQLLVMLALAAYYSIALSLVRLDHAAAIGILTGLLVFIPYVGFGLGFLLGMTAAILDFHGWPGFFAVLAVYGVGQLLESYVLVPFLVGDRIGLHPLAVIFALLAFGELFGFAGVLMALPVSAALLVGLRHLRRAYVNSPVYRED
jgi:predicted PurR-regulated permease PerM